MPAVKPPPGSKRSDVRPTGNASVPPTLKLIGPNRLRWSIPSSCSYGSSYGLTVRRYCASAPADHLYAHFGITADGLRQQADISELAGRPSLARNLRRGAELVEIPDEVLLEVYELLRPGRASSAAELLAAAQRLRADYGAEDTARLID